MRSFNKLIALVIFASLVSIATSCQKEEDGMEPDSSSEVSFNVEHFLPETTNKGSENDPNVVDCSDLKASYVVADISGEEYTLKLISLGEQTEAVKFAPGEYSLNSFVVWADNGTPDNLLDDVAVYASPVEGSYYNTLWDLDGVAKSFSVPEFDKVKISIDVLCYQPYRYDSFGFAWFEYAKHEVKTVCFYGDIGTKFYEEFHAPGTPYENQPYDGYDFPAIFSVTITDNHGNVNDLTQNSNEEWLGIGKPLCIEYLDSPGSDDTYTVEISVFMPDGTSPVIHTFTFDESNWVEATEDQAGYNNIGGDDGVYDFTVGNFSYDGNDANFELPPYSPVPTSGKLSITSATGTAYVDMHFSDIVGPTAEIYDGAVLSGWCAAEYDLIYFGQTYNIDFYSSLELGTIPAHYQDIEWGSLNWIMNNQQGTAAEIQEAIWQVINSTDTDTDNPEAGDAATSTYAIEALSNTDFIPTVGDWAIVICDVIESFEANENVQLMIVRVDP